MSSFGTFQSGFVPKRLRNAAATETDEAPNAWGKNQASEKAILRSLSRNHGTVNNGRRRNSLASRGDFGQHFRNPLPFKPNKSENTLYGVPAGSSARDQTTVQPLCMDTKASKKVDYVKQPVSEHFHTGQ
jgi:hypothetical protein